MILFDTRLPQVGTMLCRGYYRGARGDRFLALTSKQCRLMLWAGKKRFIQKSECAAIGYIVTYNFMHPMPGK